MTVRHDDLSVRWFGYATVRIETADGFVAYLDPGRYGVLSGEWDGEQSHPPGVDYHGRDADLVCVTHDHHYDPDGIERVASEGTTVVVFEGVTGGDRDVVAPNELPFDVVEVSEEDHVVVDGAVDVWSVPAYNDPDGPHVRPDGSPYHPRGSGVGYRLNLGDTPVFWPGDSDSLAGHERLSASLFLANIGGSFAMDRHDAADLAEALDPDLVLPVHYNTFDALEADSAAFAADVAERGIPVVLDERRG
jgi:L-ascorbate metabolism protein UlaG (beta-lactamase superfamily)